MNTRRDDIERTAVIPSPEPNKEIEYEVADYDNYHLCGACDGSGEGNYSGSSCPVCKGVGEIKPKKTRRDYG